jgi:hypothetical protein
MASELDSLVTVNIVVDSTAPQVPSLAKPLLVSYHTRFAENYREYTSLSEMATDGFETDDDAYRMAAAAFRQSPAPGTVYVGRLPAAPAYTKTLTITSAVEGAHVKLTVLADGVSTPIDYTIGAAATTTTVATAIELLVEALTGVSSTSSGAVVTATPAVAGSQIHFTGLQNVQVADTTADAGYDDYLTDLENELEDFYLIHIDNASSANVQAVAAWTESRKKVFGANLLDSLEEGAGGTIGAALAAAEYSRTFSLYSRSPSTFSAVTWGAYAAASDPGTYTMALKTLPGVTVDSLTSSQKGFLEADNINTYMSIAGSGRTRQGVVASGEYIDNIIGTDALEQAIQVAAAQVLFSNPKVPHNKSGYDLIKSAVLAAGQRFEGSENAPGLLNPGSFTVTTPLDRGETIDPADKAARRFNGLKFAGTYSGAIHSAGIRGTLSVF